MAGLDCGNLMGLPPGPQLMLPPADPLMNNLRSDSNDLSDTEGTGPGSANPPDPVGACPLPTTAGLLAA